MNIFTGTGVALITPFDHDYQVDEVSLRALIDYVIEGGVDYLVAMGTTSEVATLSSGERDLVMKIILSQNRGRIPVMAGIGGNNTEEVVKNVRTFPFLKECSAILSVTPYYNKPSQEGLFHHFKQISEHSSLPLFLYNVPGRTGVNMAASTVVKLSRECCNIAGIKEASGNFEQAAEILKSKREDFIVLSGDDGVALPLMSIGVQGDISVIANVFPREFSEMVRLAQREAFREAAKIHLGLSDMYKALFAEGNPAGIKAALHAKGVIKYNRLRLPLTEVSEELYARIKGLL